jgi:hypothetical protein
MKRRWNWAVWTGVVLVVVGIVSHPLYFVRFPALRDFPWVNLPLVIFGLALLAVGLVRAFRQPELHRGKIFGSVLAVLALALSGVFLYAIFIGARHVLPASHGAPQVGQAAPNFTLPDSRNNSVNLAEVVDSEFAPSGAAGSGTAAERTAGVVLIFDRGYW